jgi:hypothetical protein
LLDARGAPFALALSGFEFDNPAEFVFVPWGAPLQPTAKDANVISDTINTRRNDRS